MTKDEARERAEKLTRAILGDGSPSRLWTHTVDTISAAILTTHAEAMEEAARVADAEAVQWREAVARYPGSTGAKSRIFTAQSIATAIRAQKHGEKE